MKDKLVYFLFFAGVIFMILAVNLYPSSADAFSQFTYIAIGVFGLICAAISVYAFFALRKPNHSGSNS